MIGPQNFAYPLSASKSGLISDADRTLICSDIDMILQLNRAFLGQIADRMRLFTSKTPISDIFLSFLPHFKMYTSYCCKHAQISEAVQRLKADNKAFKSFVKKAEAHTKHPIADFLIAPVQRVPRLALLIDSLLKFTDATHPDYDSLKQALEEAQNAARLINEKMREVEVRSKVVAIHKSFDPMIEDFLDGPLVQPHRVFIHEGVLARKSGARALSDDDDWSDSEEDESEKQEDCEKGKYYCFLFNDLFLVGTSIGKGKTRRLVYETSFELATTFIRDDMNALCFQMVNPRCTYTWLTQSTAEVAEWKRAVETTVEALLERHPNLRTQRNRVDVTLDDDTNEWSAEIRMIPRRAVAVDPVSYREEVLENTQKHLTQFMHEHHEKLAKHRTTFGSPRKMAGSVFQRVKDSFTPKKRTSLKVGVSSDENVQNFVISSPTASAAGFASGFNAFGSPISANQGGNRKSEKLADLAQTVEEMDGVTCVNRHLELLNQELQAVREARRQIREGGRTVTSPTRRLNRVESMAIPSSNASVQSQDLSVRRRDTMTQLRSTLTMRSGAQSAANALKLPPSPPTSVEAMTRKKSKAKLNEKRQTLASTVSSASSRRSTVVVPPTPASPLAMPQRSVDTDSLILTRKSTPKTSRRGRMSLGGDSSKSLVSKASLPPPLLLSNQ